MSFRFLHRECMTPIKQKRWCPVHDREVAGDELVKGWEFAKGQFVVIEEAELEALEQADDSRTIDISSFVPLGEIDPAWLDRTYFLVPGDTPAQRRPYKLLVEAMRESSMGALGRFVRSGRESLCLVRARGEALVLETLFLAEDVYSQAEIDEAMEATELREAELALARQLVDGLRGSFDPAGLSSAFRRDLRELLEAKLRGEEIVAPAPEEKVAPVIDLMEALKASVAAAKGDGGAAPRKSRSRKAAAAEPAEAEPAPAKTPRKRAARS